VQNVVTYATVIDVPNPDLKLKPGMTATVNIEVARRDDVLRIPNAALRFRPTSDIFAALGQPTPPELQRGVGRGQEAGAPASGTTTAQGQPQVASSAPSPGATAAAPAARPAAAAPEEPARGPSAAARRETGTGGSPLPASSPTQAAGQAEGGRRVSGGDGSGDQERRRQFMERLQNLPPEERERVLQRMRERGFEPGASAAAPGGPGGPGDRSASEARGRRPGAVGAPPSASVPRRGGGGSAAWQQAQTIDALFRPLPEPVTPGRAWLYVGNQLKLVRLRLGVTDGTNTEIVGEEIQPGTEVVTTVILPNAAAARATGGQSPLMPQRPGFRGGPGAH
jgi:hypothetical protein